MFSRGMTRGDAYFHVLLAGCVIGGTLFAERAGSALWDSHNRGVRPALSCSDNHSTNVKWLSTRCYII